MKKLFIAILCILFLGSCGGHKRVDNYIFGDNKTKEFYLPKGKKLVDIDWRTIELDARVSVESWILIRDFTSKDSAVTYEYTNLDKTIIIHEVNP